MGEVSASPNRPRPWRDGHHFGQYSNIGILDTDEPVTAVLMMDGVEIKRHRVDIVESVAPSGEGGPITFSVDIEAH